jgi:hypothetical protein
MEKTEVYGIEKAEKSNPFSAHPKESWLTL